jgi:hypothetical protein
MGGWTLADPIACPGVFDLFAIIASRTWRDVPLGSMLAAANAVLLAMALVLFARAVYRITSSAAVTIAITLATAAASMFGAVLAPSAAAAFVVTIAAWDAVLRSFDDRQRAASPGVALFFLALLAAAVIPMMLPAAIVAGSLRWSPPSPELRRARRWHLRVLAVAAVLGTSHLMQVAMPRAHSCVMPHGGWVSLSTAGDVLAGAAREAGPLAIALALLGLLAIKRLPRGVVLSLPVLVLISLWGAALTPDRADWILPSFIIALWLLAAAGLAEVWTATGGSVAGKAGAGALSMALVALQIVSANAHRDSTTPPDGHERLTFAMMGAIVGALPRGAGLVEEDATTGLLTRALPSRLRTSDRFQVIPRNVTAITDARANIPVYALPRSQRVLQHLGFEMADATSSGVPGLAEVRQAHACTAELGTAPLPLTAITGRQIFALVAGDERTRDPVVLLLAGEVPLPVSPLGWPPNTLRGIHGRIFDLTVPVDRKDFDEELRSYELSSWSVPNTRYVTRIEAWRTPDAPLVLPIALGGTIDTGIARMTGTSADQHLRLCPSFPHDVHPPVRRH